MTVCDAVLDLVCVFQLLRLGHPDVIIKPMLDTFTYVPWADSGNIKVAQVYCEPICMSGEPLPVDPR